MGSTRSATRRIFAHAPRLRGRRRADRTIVSLTFDDGSADQLEAARLLEGFGMRGTFFVNAGLVGTPGHLSWSQLTSLAARGHEIGGHTRNHVDLTAVGAAEARAQVVDDRRMLLAAGLRVTSFAYPYGARDACAKRIVAEAGYNSGRRAWGLASSACPNCPRAERLPPEDVYATRTADSPTSETDPAELCRFVTAARRHGGWVQHVFHRVDGAGRFGISWEVLEEFIAWLDLLRREDVTVCTVAEVIGGALRPFPGGVVSRAARPGA